VSDPTPDLPNRFAPAGKVGTGARKKRGRRRVASGGRVAATGVSASALLGIVTFSMRLGAARRGPQQAATTSM